MPPGTLDGFTEMAGHAGWPACVIVWVALSNASFMTLTVTRMPVVRDTTVGFGATV